MSIGRVAASCVCGKPVGPIGFGMMGTLSCTKRKRTTPNRLLEALTFPPPFPQFEREHQTSLLKKALDQGANLWNGGLHYGTPESNSVHLLRYYFEKYPQDAEKVVLNIKEQALKGLGGAKAIDIFEMARVDPRTPIETSIKALAELVEEGKIRGIGLSEVNASTIRKAHAVHPIASVEIELSLFTPDPLHNGIMETCHELGIPVIAYSPVGRGWLTGNFKKIDDLSPNDFRIQMFDRFKPEVFDQNYKLVEAVEKVAHRKGLKTSQVAIAWVARQGAIPIPGSTNIERAIMNSRLSELTDKDMEDLYKAQQTFPVAGKRYGGAHEDLLNG
ncbi:unnamed protein product [Alternaria alternata]